MRAVPLLFLVALACGKGSPAPGSTEGSVTAKRGPAEPATPTVDAPVADDDASAPEDTAKDAGDIALPEECAGRVEGPESDGECTQDSDCARAGCSSEVCTAATSASDVMTTCEVLPCFDRLERCGCVQGRCRWSLSQAGAPKAPLPPIDLSK